MASQSQKQAEPQNQIVTIQEHPKMPVMKKTLQKMLPQYAAALPAHIKPERYLRVVITALQNNWDLLNCDPMSLLKATLTCAQLGLEPDPNLGQAYFIPFKSKVQFIPGYKGLIALARNSGEISSLSAHVVHENDHFDYEFGLNERLEHKPCRGEKGAITHAYAVARFKDGSHYFDVLTVEEIEQIRAQAPSASASSSPWKTHYPEMCKKTAIRRIAKYLPQSVQKAALLEDGPAQGKILNLENRGQEFSSEFIDIQVEEPESDRSTNSLRLEQFADNLDEETGEILTVDPEAQARLDAEVESQKGGQ